MIEQIDLRDAFFDALYKFAAEDRNVLCLTADMGAWSLQKFRKDMPDQFFNTGIAEQNMISIAAGLALNGKKVFVYTIIPFLTLRCLEQIKVDLCMMNLPVTLVGSGPGFTYASDGPTHHAIEDVSVMRAFPNMAILNPCDQFAACAAAQMAINSNSPMYIRIDKGKHPVVHKKEVDFRKGLLQVKDGSDILLVATGIITHQAVVLAEELESSSIKVGVLDVFGIKPFNETEFLKHVKNYKAIVTIEEHTVNGGMGSIVLEVLSDHDIKVPVKRFGVADTYYELYGGRDWLYERSGLNLTSLKNEITRWFTDVL